ncbi:MAG: hypothetical protein PHN82_11260 [bacterium]|nr:hypothetical protein [bacterium]
MRSEKKDGAMGGGGRPPDLAESRLVPLLRVRDRIQADEIIGILRQEGIEAVWRVPISPAYDGLEEFWLGRHYGEMLVLDMDLERAKAVISGHAGSEQRA